MNLKVDLAGVTLNNPIMTASGTFGSGEEYSEFVDLNRLGAVVTKGVANVPVGRKSNSTGGGSLWRNAQCYRIAESGH